MMPALASLLEGRAGRGLLRAARICASPLQLVRRRAVARDWLRRAAPSPRIDRGTGFATIKAGVLPGTDAILAECRRRLDEMAPYLDRIHATSRGKFHLTAELLSDELHARRPAFVDFALHDGVLLPVVEYLGTLPYLARVALVHSIHLDGREAPDYHQRFHVDNDDFRQVKLFLNAGDVAPEDGPLCFLPADASARALRGLRREGRRIGRATTFSDEEIFRHVDRSSLVTMVGPAGTGAFLDLSRCLHYGSRVGRGHARLMLAATFLRYHRLVENASSQLEADRPGLDAIRRLALTPPRRRPRGYFLPDPVEALVERERGARAP